MELLHSLSSSELYKNDVIMRTDYLIDADRSHAMLCRNTCITQRFTMHTKI